MTASPGITDSPTVPSQSRVLLDASGVRGGGVETFLIGLLPPLVEATDTLRYTLLVPASRSHLYEGLDLDLERVDDAAITSTRRRLLHEHFGVPGAVRRSGADLYFRADEMLPPLVALSGVPTLAVFHGTQHFFIPDELGDGPVRLAYVRRMKSLTMRLATACVTVSHHARAELSGLFRNRRGKIRVIYHGIDREAFHPGERVTPAFLAERGVDRYLLTLADRHAHKNIPRLVAAYGALVASSDVREDLVIAGRVKDVEEEERIRAAIAAEGLESRVHLLDYVEPGDVPDVYRGATAYVTASLYETFGLTPLEAMGCGIPVASSGTSCLPEVCGDAAEYFDPLDVDDMRDALARLLLDEDRRRRLIDLGAVHVSRFRWESAARHYTDLILKTLGRA